jgi:hypothetical protein
VTAQEETAPAASAESKAGAQAKAD